MADTAGVLRTDLVDAVAAYQYYLDGQGKPREFSDDRYVMNDNCGRVTLRNAILEAQYFAIELYKSHRRTQFNFTGPAIPCGSFSSQFAQLSMMYPYPATENWQKAIGAHYIWLSASVRVAIDPRTSAAPEFSMDFVIHAEDQYNFNPGAKDIATGLPDDANGRFVVVGLAHGYRNNATLKRSFNWKGYQLGVASKGIRIHMRTDKPELNR